MDDKSLDRLFSGEVEKLIPFPKRVVRLFISSTFTDMTLERNSLMERVYPKLKNYCREKHGLDFQVVDMRWGVRDEATDDHQTVTLCSREIDNCQRVSLGPNFVALIGDKYGFRPLLNRIKSSEYRALRRCLIELDISTDTLDTWYREDLNAVPPEHLLQPISSILKNFTNRNEPELQSVDQRIWQAIQERLHELLLIGSSRLVKQGRMSEREQLMKYSISVTEREVIEGCLDINDAKSHCLVFVRSITDLKQHLDKCLNTLESINSQQASQQSLNASSAGDEASNRRKSSGSLQGENRRASLKIGDDSISITTNNAQTVAEKRAEKTRRLIGRYIDLTSKNGVWMMDNDAQLALENLRVNKLAKKLASNGKNLINYQVHWSENDGLSLRSDEHKHYLNDLTESFYSNLTKMIRKASKQEQSIKSGLIGEVLQHSHYAKHVSKTFHGRKQELDKLRAYILCRFEAGAIPMFLYGVDGSGKTSISARAATLAKSWIHAIDGPTSGSIVQTDESKWDQKPCIIMRFCCTTPNSSSMVGVLTSVCRQLQYNFYQFGPLNGVMNQFGATIGDHGSIVEDKANIGAQLPYERVPEDFVRLVFKFRRLLDNCQHQYHRRRKFIIILDSIDRLSSPAESSIEVKYSWLTSIIRLPPNVRLIVSCSSDVNSNKLADFKYLKRHFLELNQNYRKRSIFLTSFDSDDSCADESHDSVTTYEKQYPQPLGADYSTQASSRKLTEIAVDRYRFVKRILVPAVRLLRSSSRNKSDDKDKSESDSKNQLRVNTPTFAIGNLLAPKRRDSGRQLTGGVDGVDRDRSGRLSAVPRDSFEDLGEEFRSPPRAQSSWILHVKPMGVKLAISVIRRWLTDFGRTLTQQQWSILENSFGHCSRPIFVKLVFGEVINWKSYSTQSDARGLTFGSTLLGSEDLIASLRASGAEQDEALRKLMESQSSSQSKGSENDNEFIWQVLSMEQQWLNYLDYRQRQIIESSERGKQQDGSLVIRLGQQAIGGLGSKGASSGELISTSTGSSANSNPLSSSICHLSNTINDAICQLFVRIELQHGYVLTKHSLSYITAARNGICENELEDILSLDDVVLDDVFQYHLPPVRRIPPLLWTRIRNDLPDYLSERDADGMIVINWHHSQFKQVTYDRYLTDPRQRNYIYSTMADYFLGKWADKAKPFRCTKQQIQMAAEQLESAVQQSIRDSQSSGRPSLSNSRLANGRTASVRAGTSFSVRQRLRSSDQRDSRLQWMQAKADRRVPHQPLYYGSRSNGELETSSDDHGENFISADKSTVSSDDHTENTARRNKKRKYNLRKLTELPYHLMCSGRFIDLANNVLFNYNWLSAAIDSMGLQALLADFRETSTRIESVLRETERQLLESQSPQDLTSVKTLETITETPELIDNKLEMDALRSLRSQVDILSNALRLSSSSIHSDTQMLAPQLLARLLPLVRRSRLPARKSGSEHNKTRSPSEYLEQLLEQCDKDGSNDCSLLPIDHCLQSPDGLQSSSLEGHQFAVMSMVMAADQRHLLAISNKFIMWDISTGELARDIDPKIEASLMLDLRMGLNNQYAVAYTNDNLIIVLDILTQQIAKFSPRLDGQILGLNLIDTFGATRFLVWTSENWLVLRIVANDEFERSTGFVSMAQKFSIEPEYTFELNDIHIEKGSQILSIQHEQWNDLTFVMVASRNASSISQSYGNINLFTLKTFNEKANNDSRLVLWPQSLPAAVSMALNSSLDQLVFSCANGCIYLSRRRQTRWSKPKLMSSGLQSRNNHILDTSSLSDIIGSDFCYNVENRTNTSPQSIELDSCEDCVANLDKFAIMSLSDRSDLMKLERQVDNLRTGEEIKPTEVFTTSDTNNEDPLESGGSENISKNLSAPIELIRLYYSDRVVVIELRKSLPIEKTLMLPRDVRNVCIEANKSQIKSTVINTERLHCGAKYLVVAAGRRLLFYSIDQEQLIKSIEAHGARILKLLPVLAADFGSGSGQSGCCVASASMDKIVSIWNLSNLNKETHRIEKLEGSIDYLDIAKQRPLAACLSKGHFGIFDWRTLKLVYRLPSLDIESSDGLARSLAISGCKFSTSSRYLCLNTRSSIHLYSLDGPKSPLGSSSSMSKLSEAPNLRSSFVYSLPMLGTVRKVKFFMQDSRLLITVDCLDESTKRNSGSSETTTTTTSAQRSTIEGDDDSGTLNGHLLSHIVILCFSVPEGRPLYKIDYYTPIVNDTSDSHYLTATKTAGKATNSKRVRLPIMTKDQLHIVTVEFEISARRSRSPSPERRRSSAVVKIPIQLNIYSTRDGSLSKTIDLSQLEHTEFQINSPKKEVAHTGTSSRLSAHHKRADESKINTPQGQLRRRLVSISNDQFTRLKSIIYLERQSVVALIDDNKGVRFLIDVYARQLVTISTIWNGKVSSDGRHGLSRMFKSASLRRSINISNQRDIASMSASSSSSSSNILNSDGLQLLEMRHCRPIKSLFSNNHLLKLSGQDIQTTGSDLDITCAFTIPNNLYVYCYNSRLRRLLLIRIRDNKLIANYKLSVPVTCIKCTNEGYSLILSHSDGSLTSLAIVDPQQSDTLTRLSQFPSRCKN